MKFILRANKKSITFTANTKEELMAIVKDHCEKNNINFAASVVSAHIDAQNNFSKPKEKKVSISDAYNGARAVLRYVAGNSVSNAELNRRAEICRTCPQLKITSGCMSCGAGGRIARLVNTIRAYKKSESQVPKPVENKYCGVCSCSIPMMILTRYKDFYKEATSKNSTRPDNCWLKETSENFTNE
jgi:hypothetical protein